MEIGIDSFAANNQENNELNNSANAKSIEELIERIELADKLGIDCFGIGEHHRKDFLDSAPSMILAAAAAKTSHIKLTSAVAVLSAQDPVRTFQNYATLDLISNGRAEMIVGRGSFSEAFPLFGLDFNDYDALYDEKLKLLLQIRDTEFVTWKGKFRPELINQPIYPRPLQEKLPIWVGIGGTPESAIRAGKLGLPLMIAIIGGETHRFRSIVELYKNAGIQAGHDPASLKVGIHSLGYVAETTEQAKDEFFPGYEKVFNKIGQERGWSKIDRAYFDRITSDTGALVVGSPEDVAKKICRHSDALGGLARFSFQMNVATLTHKQLLNSIELIAKKVIPLIKNKN
jgi:probable LLM family oxidoreductase